MASARRTLGVLFVLSALVAGAGAYWLYDRYTGFADAPLSGIEAGTTLQVARGDSFRRVLARLREAGVRDGHDLEWQLLRSEERRVGKECSARGSPCEGERNW